MIPAEEFLGADTPGKRIRLQKMLCGKWVSGGKLRY